MGFGFAICPDMGSVCQCSHHLALRFGSAGELSASARRLVAQATGSVRNLGGAAGGSGRQLNPLVPLGPLVGWTECWSVRRNAPYWCSETTGEVVWSRPR